MLQHHDLAVAEPDLLDVLDAEHQTVGAAHEVLVDPFPAFLAAPRSRSLAMPGARPRARSDVFELVVRARSLEMQPVRPGPAEDVVPRVPV